MIVLIFYNVTYFLELLAKNIALYAIVLIPSITDPAIYVQDVRVIIKPSRILPQWVILKHYSKKTIHLYKTIKYMYTK